MATSKGRAAAPATEDAVALTPETAPPPGTGRTDHSFTLQAVMELHKAVGEMNANLLAVRSSVDGLKGKVDDLVGWKNKILGGAAVLATVIAFMGFVVGKGWDYVQFRAPPQPQPTAAPAPAPAPVPGASAPARP